MSLQILDTTLRDGSNAINFKFDKELTQKVLLGLEDSGVGLIEMGHGMGLGAHLNSGKPAVLSDEEYMDIAANTLKKSKFGFIILKKFGNKKDIKLAAKKGAGFIRIGSNITEVDQIEDMVKYAKSQGLMVLIALMKSYALKPKKEYIKILQKLHTWGADLAVLMDSAGYMLPKEVSEYITQAKVNTDLPIGFHAHNNLHLAIANSISAIKSGADSIDGSIGGLGRSAGNAPIEILAVLGKRYNWNMGLNYKKLSDINDKYIFPLIKNENRFSSSAITYGAAGFHSSFSNLIEEASQKYPKIDYRDIILAVSEQEKVNLNADLIDKIIKENLL
jgi:4-hydroxy-2-oxovalerate aldolase